MKQFFSFFHILDSRFHRSDIAWPGNTIDRWWMAVIVVIGILFFIMAVLTNPYSFDSSAAVVLDSPDETANFFWAQQVGGGGELWYYEPLNSIGNNLLRPRSFNVVDGKVVPGSFVGLPLLYGSLARGLGVGVIPYLTPLFSCLALIAFGALIGKLFGRGIGVISAALLAVLPSWWYYAARGFYHNTLFLCLVMIGVSLLVYAVDNYNVHYVHKAFQAWVRILGWGAAGLVFGYAAVVRSSEIVLVTLLVVATLLFSSMAVWRKHALKEFPLPGFFLFIACGIFALVPLFITNIELYGAPISIGYGGVQGMELGEFFTKLPQAQFRNLFLAPFGFNFSTARDAARVFLVEYYRWWFWPVAAGIAIAFVRMRRREERGWAGYALLYACVSLLLVVYYGSWEFSDRIDREAVSLNTSFFRYWLPIYVMGVPFISVLVSQCITVFKRRWIQLAVAAVMIGLFAYPSAARVLIEQDESLITIRARQDIARAERASAARVLPMDAVIVTFPQADKILFPARTRIITGLYNEADYRAINSLSSIAPVYLYTFAPPEYVERVMAPQFKKHALNLVNGKGIFQERWLWNIVPLQN